VERLKPKQPESLGMSVPEAAAYFLHKPWWIYQRLRCGDLEAVRIGAKTIVTHESIERYRSSLRKATFTPPRVKSGEAAHG
jgi:hypothetical protein